MTLNIKPREYFFDDYGEVYNCILDLRKNTKHGPIIRAIHGDDYDTIVRALQKAIEQRKGHTLTFELDEKYDAELQAILGGGG